MKKLILLFTLSIVAVFSYGQRATSGSIKVSATDENAIHVNAAGEINGVSEKVTPVGDDELIIENSESGFAKAKIKLSSLPGGSGEANTASNAGSGVSVFYQKSGVDLQFNGIKSENNLISVILDAISHDVELTFNQANIVITASQVSDFDTEVSNNTDVTANTAKVTNATHTGEVTGSEALTVSNDVVDYANIDETLKSKTTDNDGAWDFSANGIIEATFSTNTTITFSNLELNKTLKVRLTLSSGALPTLPAYVVTLNGSESFADGTFYLYFDCWNTSGGSEEVLLSVVKSQ